MIGSKIRTQVTAMLALPFDASETTTQRTAVAAGS